MNTKYIGYNYSTSTELWNWRSDKKSLHTEALVFLIWLKNLEAQKMKLKDRPLQPLSSSWFNLYFVLVIQRKGRKDDGKFSTTEGAAQQLCARRLLPEQRKKLSIGKGE